MGDERDSATGMYSEWRTRSSSRKVQKRRSCFAVKARAAESAVKLGAGLEQRKLTSHLLKHKLLVSENVRHKKQETATRGSRLQCHFQSNVRSYY